MRKSLLLVATAAGGLALATIGTADARMISGTGDGYSAHTGVSSRMTTTHHGPRMTPPGWSHGRKVGWNCHVGSRGCVPPGLR
jgi:hypothetical protein